MISAKTIDNQSLNQLTLNAIESAPVINPNSITTQSTITNEFKLPTDAIDGYVLTSDADGNGTWEESKGGGDNIYNANGTLSANRTVNMGSNNLTFSGTGTIAIPTGTASAPSLNFSNNTGIWQNGPGLFAISTAGVQRLELNGSRLFTNVPYHLANGSATSPSLSFNADTSRNTGLYYIANDVFGISSGGNNIAVFGPTTSTFANKVVCPTFQLTTTPTLGHVLTADASGNATWQAPSSGNNIYNADGALLADRTLTCDDFKFTIQNGTLTRIEVIPDTISLVSDAGIGLLATTDIGIAADGNLSLGCDGNLSITQNGNAGSEGQVLISDGTNCTWGDYNRAISQFNGYDLLTSVDPNPASRYGLISSNSLAASTSITGADTIGLNTALVIDLGDDATVSTNFVGVAGLALPAVVKMGVNSTIDRLSGAVFAISMDGTATGGTIDTMSICRSAVVPNNITTTTRCYGYSFEPTSLDLITNCWPFYSAVDRQSYMKGGLLVGEDSDLLTNESCGLEINSATKALVVSRMTETERNALNEIDGMVVYNTTSDSLQVHSNSAWYGMPKHGTVSGLVSFNTWSVVSQYADYVDYGNYVVVNYFIELTVVSGNNNTMTFDTSANWTGVSNPTNMIFMGSSGLGGSPNLYNPVYQSLSVASDDISSVINTQNGVSTGNNSHFISGILSFRY